ncbi:MAG: hypothetical protein PHX64_04775 [Candidatus Omnitrophica bacterium]|nr:hypothetical protein [Candidatus Omnitrophota bacterium]MDD5311046.1 hypothetical protein [Candidatus Omnitrophota bacterium]MDD5546481.1 hypothetical protein [Candidatus Omnitrophota bacterium]
MRVIRAVGQGLSITHRGWPIIAVIFIFYAAVRFFAAPNDAIPPYMKKMGDWGATVVIFAALVLGFNYLLAGAQIFARDAIRERRFGFNGFFGNCSRFFLGQLGVSAVLWIPAWILALVMAVLMGGAMMESKLYPLTAAVLGAFSAVVALLLAVFYALICLSWAITAADGRGIFRSIWRSVIFCGERFFSVFGLLILFFVLMIVISLVVWIAYAFVVQGLRRLGLDGHIIILREVTGCMLNAYFFLFLTSTLMSYYLNNRKEDERYN